MSCRKVLVAHTTARGGGKCGTIDVVSGGGGGGGEREKKSTCQMHSKRNSHTRARATHLLQRGPLFLAASASTTALAHVHQAPTPDGGTINASAVRHDESVCCRGRSGGRSRGSNKHQAPE